MFIKKDRQIANQKSMIHNRDILIRDMEEQAKVLHEENKDLRFENGRIISDYTKRASTDQSLKGIKKITKEKGEEYSYKVADLIIKNTYKTLMTRGMKGCFVYCTDKTLNNYFKEHIFKNENQL